MTILRRIHRQLVLVLSLLPILAPFRAGATTIGFEGLSDGTSVDNFYAGSGVTFTNALVLTAGISLNEVEFPPHSGQNVVLDNGGPITLSFSSLINSFSAYFTYVASLQAVAYDDSSNQVDLVSSLFTDNSTSSGNPTNELLSLSFANGIRKIVLAGDPAGGSFVMDDVNFTAGEIENPPGNPVPEPQSFWLIGTGIVTFYQARRWARAHSRVGSNR